MGSILAPLIATFLLLSTPVLGQPPSSNPCLDAARKLLRDTRGIQFWRLINGPKPRSAEELAGLYDMYGTRNLVFLGDLPKTGKPLVVDGYVWYDTMEQIDLVKGTRGGNAIAEQLKWHKLVSNDKGADIDLILKPYAPEAIAKSEMMPAALKKFGVDFATMDRTEAFRKLQAALKREFPDGFFMKVRNGYDSRGAFPSEKSDLVAVFAKYERDYKPRRLALEASGKNAEEVQDALNDLPGYYEGAVLDDLVSGRAGNLYLEQKLKIAKSSAYRNAAGKLKTREREYRVILDENGKVVTSQNRWDERRLYDQAEADEAGRFAQSVSDRLPPEKRGPAGWDVVRLADGRWSILERNIWDVGGWYPKTNTLTANLLAERIAGSTPIQAAFKEFLAAPGIEAKADLFKSFLERDGIKPLLAERAPLTEYLLQAKEAFMSDLRAAPTLANTDRVVQLAKAFNLGDQFSKADLDLLADLLVKNGKPEDELAQLLGPFDVLTHPPGKPPALLVTDYDDAYVQELLASRVKALGGAPERKAVEDLVNQAVTTTTELKADPARALGLSGSRSAPNAATSTARLAYHGDKSALISALLGP